MEVFKPHMTMFSAALLFDFISKRSEIFDIASEMKKKEFQLNNHIPPGPDCLAQLQLETLENFGSRLDLARDYNTTLNSLPVIICINDGSYL